MAEVRQGRWTAKIEGDFVVFIIGARFDLRNPVRSLVDLGGRMGLPQMLKYWKRLGKSDRTGIWHETFLVRAGEYEAVYGNMPPRGLAKATELIPLSADTTARKRLKNLPD